MSGSLFDIVGPAMIGPSSSHTAGAVRLGNLALFIAQNTGKRIRAVTFDLYNSFAKTYQGHGTDRGLLAGVLGYGVQDENIRDAYQLATQHGLEFHFNPIDRENNYSPNTVVFNLTLADDAGQTKPMTVVGHSIGGGKVYVSRINDYHVTLRGEAPTLLLFYKDQPGMIWQATKVLAEEHINIATLTCTRLERNVQAFMTICLDSMPSSDSVAKIRAINDMYVVWCIDRLPS